MINRHLLSGHRSNNNNPKETSIWSRLLSLDMYGKPVSLTFNGKEKIKTHFGAIITCLVSLALLIFGLNRWFNTLTNSSRYVPVH